MTATRGVDDWVKAAFEMLAKRGAGAIKVEPLAKALGVTKGSFYWHFRDRAALLQAILVEWERTATSQVIELVEARGGDAKKRLARLMVFTAGPPKADRIEQAIRTWGATDPDVRKALERVDRRREAYVRDLLVDGGVSEKAAAQRSHALYLMLIGEFTSVSHGSERTAPEVWQAMIELCTVS